MEDFKIRCSQSVIGFKDRAIKTWGLEEWKGWTDNNASVVFFGLYTKHDYDAFLRHKGKKIVFWCGSDILNLQGNYDSRRVLKLFPETEHYCENEVEAEGLRRAGIEAKIVPSFLDDIEKFPVCFKPSENPQIFLCGHDKREDEYGVSVVERIADKVPFATFHIYGIDKDSPYFSGIKNVVCHGKVPEAQFNEEIKGYQAGMRTNDHDGFSEVIAKSVLLGQYPISKIKYDKIWNYTTDEELVDLIEKLKLTKEPNIEGREHYQKILNKFPFIK